MQTVVTAEKLWDGTTLHPHPLILIEDGKIESIASRDSSQMPSGARVLDFPGATLGPAFFDVHIHGAAGHDVMEATPEAIETMGKFLASRGTATYLATTVTASLDATLRALDGLANEIAKLPQPGRARPLGIHLEGPFLSHEKRGVQPAEHLLAPSIATFDRLLDAAHGHVRLMTLAPELPGATELASTRTRNAAFAFRLDIPMPPLRKHARALPPAPSARPTLSMPCALSIIESPESSARFSPTTISMPS